MQSLRGNTSNRIQRAGKTFAFGELGKVSLSGIPVNFNLPTIPSTRRNFLVYILRRDSALFDYAVY